MCLVKLYIVSSFMFTKRYSSIQNNMTPLIIFYTTATLLKKVKQKSQFCSHCVIFDALEHDETEIWRAAFF